MDTVVEKDLCPYWEWARSCFFFKKDRLFLIMVCHIGVWLGTKVVKAALRMLALYMFFNGTGFCAHTG